MTIWVQSLGFGDSVNYSVRLGIVGNRIEPLGQLADGVFQMPDIPICRVWSYGTAQYQPHESSWGPLR